MLADSSRPSSPTRSREASSCRIAANFFRIVFYSAPSSAFNGERGAEREVCGKFVLTRDAYLRAQQLLTDGDAQADERLRLVKAAGIA